MKLTLLAATLLGASAFVLPAARPPLSPLARAAAPLELARTPCAPAAARRNADAIQMGLFGLGTPELMVIAGVALVILGPDKVKDLAKEVGKASAELKQVPEEFAKGMEAGADAGNAKMAAEAPPPKEVPAAKPEE